MKNNVQLKPQEAAYDGRKNDAESKTGLDVSKKKQGRGRATSTGRGRGSKTNNDVTKSQFLIAPVSAASQLEVSDQKVRIVYFIWSYMQSLLSSSRIYIYWTEFQWQNVDTSFIL